MYKSYKIWLSAFKQRVAEHSGLQIVYMLVKTDKYNNKSKKQN